jgi:hypothetical protein
VLAVGEIWRSSAGGPTEGSARLPRRKTHEAESPARAEASHPVDFARWHVS